MSLSQEEQENVYRLLYSGQLESIRLGLKLAKTLKLNIQSFQTIAKDLYKRIYPEKDVAKIPLSRKISRLYQLGKLKIEDLNSSEILLPIMHLTQLSHLEMSLGLLIIISQAYLLRSVI